MDLFSFLLILFLAFANGANDVSKSIATLVGSGVTSYRIATTWGAVWTAAGAGASAIVAEALVQTFGDGLLQGKRDLPAAIAPAVLLSSTAWVLLASHIGLPVSTTHALTGGIIGAGWLALGSTGIVWEAIVGKIAMPLMLSPLLALLVSRMIHPAIARLTGHWDGACLCVMPASRALVAVASGGATRILFQSSGVGRPVVDVPVQCDRKNLSGWVVGLDSIHWLSSGLASFARGTNDAPKIVAMLLLGHATTPWSTQASPVLAFTAVTLAMGLGSLYGGGRVTELLAERVTPLNHAEGLSANLTTSSLVLVSTFLGLPVSTTHVSASAIIGIGLLTQSEAVRWPTVRDMIFAWFLTLPSVAFLGGLLYGTFWLRF